MSGTNLSVALSISRVHRDGVRQRSTFGAPQISPLALSSSTASTVSTSETPESLQLFSPATGSPATASSTSSRQATAFVEAITNGTAYKDLPAETQRAFFGRTRGHSCGEKLYEIYTDMVNSGRIDVDVLEEWQRSNNLDDGIAAYHRGKGDPKYVAWGFRRFTIGPTHIPDSDSDDD